MIFPPYKRGFYFLRLLVDYCDVFITCLDSPSDGTHSLQRTDWWASDVIQNISKSVPDDKQMDELLLEQNSSVA